MSYPTSHELSHQLLALGATPGAVLLVHTSFRAVGPVEGGPAGLIAALTDAIGPEGTLVMPSMSDDDDVPFDAASTPCLDMGVVADAFWRLPGVLRSDSPHAFAARGPAAAGITADHPVDIPHGPDSPVGRVSDLDGDVLLLGVGHDANTTIHLAENLAEVRYRRPKHVVVRRGAGTARIEYKEIDHCCQRFALMDDWLREGDLQREGPLARATARLMKSRDVVQAARSRLAGEETIFLDPPGVDIECDEARASLPQG